MCLQIAVQTHRPDPLRSSKARLGILPRVHEPLRQAVKGGPSGDVVHQQGTWRTTKVGGGKLVATPLVNHLWIIYELYGLSDYMDFLWIVYGLSMDYRWISMDLIRIYTYLYPLVIKHGWLENPLGMEVHS